MGIGKFRQRIKIYSLVQGQPDGLGGYATSKELQLECWASVTQQTGRRDDENRQVSNKQTYQIKMRTGAFNLVPENLIEWEGQEFTINTITTDPLKRLTIAIVWGLS